MTLASWSSRIADRPCDFESSIYYSGREGIAEGSLIIRTKSEPSNVCILSVRVKYVDQPMEKTDEKTSSSFRKRTFSLLAPKNTPQAEKIQYKTFFQGVKAIHPKPYSREQIAREIMQTDNVAFSLQEYAACFPSQEFQRILLEQASLFTTRLREPKEYSSVRACSAQGGSSLYVLESSNSISGMPIAGVYVRRCFKAKKGVAKKVHVYNPFPFTQGRALAIATLSKKIQRDNPKHQIAQNPYAYMEYECCLSQLLREKNVPYIIDAWCGEWYKDLRSKSVPCMIMEYCECSLLEFIEQEQDMRARLTLCLQFVQAVKAMHALDVFHLDLKDKNILICRQGDRVEIRIIDFGSAVQGKDALIKTGSTYPAPELFFAQQLNASIGAQSWLDMWNVGDIIHCFLHDYSLLDEYNLKWDSEDYEQGLCEYEAEREALLRSESEIDRCIGKLVSRRPYERPSIDEVEQIVQRAIQGVSEIEALSTELQHIAV